MQGLPEANCHAQLMDRADQGLTEATSSRIESAVRRLFSYLKSSKIEE